MKDSNYFEWACDLAREFAEVSSTNDELVQAIPAIDSLVYGAALSIKGVFTDEVRAHLGRIFTRIIPLAEDASDGDSTAMVALEAINSLVTPNLLNISPQTLKQLADRAYKSWFARATILIGLMGDLSWVVEPTRNNAKTMRTGSVRPLAKLTKEIKKAAVFNQDEKIETLHILAVQHCRKNTTLQALAIKVFNALNERDGYESQDERVLKRDLQMFKKWVAENPRDALECAWLSLRGEKEVIYE
ncbi:MAG TPA: hypothetical protein VGX24_07325 [Pyrinomonadaceae bacterium]|jgi:hypothetical protein|nr:hypothetical protein [Pyrinomonadaceae bacterium]